MYNKKSSLFLLVTAFICVPTLFAHASTPSVTSLTASPSNINSALTTLLSWTMTDSSGQDMYIKCVDGVSIKNSSDDTAIPCDTAYSFGTGIYSQVALTFINVSGTSKVMQIQMFPKDLEGVDYTAGANSTVVSVNADPQPITEFSISSTSIASGGPLTLSWTGQYITGANIKFTCVNNTRVYEEGSSIPLKCETPIATDGDLPQSGSKSFTIVNDSLNDSAKLIFIIMPAMRAGLYDGLHGLNKQIIVAPKTATQTASVNYFIASQSLPQFGIPLSLVWSINNAIGANLQFSCNQSLSIYSEDGTLLPCNTPAFTTPQSASSSVSIVVNSKTMAQSLIKVWLFPQQADGMYTSINASSIPLLFTSTTTTSELQTPTTLITPYTGTQSVTTPTTKSAVMTRFTSPLTRGSRGAQVTALQTLLAKDPTIYPGGLVTGYFGAATETAVKRFQLKYKITTAASTAYGFVGPLTRSILNTLAGL